MTRKDYVLIAQAIKRVLDTNKHTDDTRATVEVTAREVSNVLQQDNPRFDRERFMRACGFES